MTDATERQRSIDFIFALGATQRLQTMTDDEGVVVLSATDGTFSIYDEEADETLEADLTQQELMDRLDEAATLNLNRIFGDGSLIKSNADLHATIQRFTK